MRVAVKFCGGCDPAYERVAYWEEIGQAAGQRVTWTRLEDPGNQAVLLICGCACACIEQEISTGLPVVCLRDPQTPPQQVIAKLLESE